LLLGGAQHQVCAIEAAKRLGYRTVLCDYLPDNPGQHVADVFYQLSTADRELMLEVARKERADGVLSFGSDVALPSAAYVAERLGLPSNSLQSVEVLSTKHKFRAYLREHGFNCPRAVALSSDVDPRVALAQIQEEGLVYPIMLKPTDSSGSKGVTVLDEPDPEAMEAAVQRAAHFSRNATLIAEERLRYEHPYLIGGDIFVAQGRIAFWGLMACLRDQAISHLVPVGKAYPPRLDAPTMQRVHDELQRLVESLDLRFGEMNVEVIVGPGGTPYVLELGGRAGGNLIPQQLTDISGIDLVEASVRYAMGDESMDVSFDGNGAAALTHVVHARTSGILEGVEIDAELAPHVYRALSYVQPGDEVVQMRNGSDGIGHLFMSFDSTEQMWTYIPRLNDLVRVNVREEVR
jgi:biotin carboxylase